MVFAISGGTKRITKKPLINHFSLLPIELFCLREEKVTSFGLIAFVDLKKVDNESLNDYKVPLCSEDPAEKACNDSHALTLTIYPSRNN